MTTLVIRNGTVIDQLGERRADVVVVDGRIAQVGTDVTAPDDATTDVTVLDAFF